MKLGTKSLLFGCHQVVLHAIFVLIAWIKIYKKFPPWRVLLAIIIHDWGLWGSEKMDDEKGENHPEWAAKVMGRLYPIKTKNTYYADNGDRIIGWSMASLVRYHSRFLAKKDKYSVSPLCLADKLGTALMPIWLWVGLAMLSGEGKEYLADAKYEVNNIIPTGSRKKGPWEHFKQYKEICAKWVSGDEPLCPWETREKEGKMSVTPAGQPMSAKPYPETGM